jgi:hypothetical protein
MTHFERLFDAIGSSSKMQSEAKEIMEASECRFYHVDELDNFLLVYDMIIPGDYRIYQKHVRGNNGQRSYFVCNPLEVGEFGYLYGVRVNE